MNTYEQGRKVAELAAVINDQLVGMDGPEGIMILAGAVIANVITASNEGMEDQALEAFAGLLSQAAEDGPLKKWRLMMERSNN